MNRIQTHSAAEVMRAFADGHTIQIAKRGRDNWRDYCTPKWDWTCSDYRIKPTPKVVPWTADEAIGRVVRISEGTTHSKLAVSAGNRCVITSTRKGWARLSGVNGEIRLNALHPNCECIDGSICGTTNRE